MAARSMVEATKKELQPDVKASSPPRSSPPSPRKQRKTSISSLPPQTRTANRRSLVLDDDIDPEEQLLRNLGVSIPLDAKSNHQRAQVLDQALTDRANKLQNHAAGLQSTMESSISSHIHDAYVTLQLLKRAQLSDSQYGKVQMLDSKLESGLEDMQSEIKQVQESLAAVDLRELQSKNTHREQMIQRWSR